MLHQRAQDQMSTHLKVPSHQPWLRVHSQPQISTAVGHENLAEATKGAVRMRCEWDGLLIPNIRPGLRAPMGRLRPLPAVHGVNAKAASIEEDDPLGRILLTDVETRRARIEALGVVPRGVEEDFPW